MFQSWREITFQAPCKINLHLSIGAKRPDGYHELESIFAALDFADTLTFMPFNGQEGQTSLTVRHEWPFPDTSLPLVTPEKNLVSHAAELFREKTGFSQNIAIELVKRIPVGAGLGGGSSDAAATLLVFNALAGSESPKKELLSQQELMELAARMGSDIPFFVKIAGPDESPSCAVGGRGELLESLPLPPSFGILLAFPGFLSETAAAYKLLDTVRKESGDTVLENKGRLGAALENDFWTNPENWEFKNDFLAIFLQHSKEKDIYQAILSDLQKAGAVFTGLSGSGSACFGVFPDKGLSEKANQYLQYDKKGLSGAFYTIKTTFFLHSKASGLIIN